MAYLYRKFIKDEFYILNMPRKKKKEFKWFPEHPCKVCGRLIPEPMMYCSSECARVDEIAKEHAKKCPDSKLLEPTEEEAKTLGLKRLETFIKDDNSNSK
jgi:hypothetical protein